MVNVAKIEMLIDEKGWSNSHFCSLFNKNSGWIRDWKRGRGLPDENMLQDIADKLDTTIDYLTDKTDAKEQKNKAIPDRDSLIDEAIDIMDNLPEDLKAAALAQLKALAALSDKKQKK